MKSTWTRRAASGMLVLLPALAVAVPPGQGELAFTESSGPNPVLREGHSLLAGATRIAPSGADTTMAQVHVPPDPAFDRAVPDSPAALFPDQYFARVPDAGPTGAWQIRATDASGTNSATTHLLDDPRRLPLVGDPLASTPGWTRLDPAVFPSGCTIAACVVGFDLFSHGVIVRNSAGEWRYQSSANRGDPGSPAQGALAAGLLTPGESSLLGEHVDQSELAAVSPDGSFTSPPENRSAANLEYTAPVAGPAAAWLALAGLGLLKLAAARRLRQRTDGLSGSA